MTTIAPDDRIAVLLYHEMYTLKAETKDPKDQLPTKDQLTLKGQITRNHYFV